MSTLPSASKRLDPAVATLLLEARDRCAAMLALEKGITAQLHLLCARTWELGKSLADLKLEVRPGQWMFFVAANFPELGDTEATRVRRANDAAGFFRDNPDYPISGNFQRDSIRARIFHLAPDKERPELAGNESVSRPPVALTFVNNFMQWDRRATKGLVALPDKPTLQREFEPVLKRMIELLGPEYVQALLT